MRVQRHRTDDVISCYDSDGKPADTGPLNPTLNLTYDVINKLYAEILDVFAPEKFVHVGGDEVPSACWASYDAQRSNMRERTIKKERERERERERECVCACVCV